MIIYVFLYFQLKCCFYPVRNSYLRKHTFAKICVKSIFFPISSHKTSYTFQLLQIFEAMRPEDDSCMDKVKEMYPRSKFKHLKVGNLQNINKTDIPSGSVLESIPKCLHNRHVHAQCLKMIEFYSPFGKRHVFLYSINTNKNENTYQIHCLHTRRRHFAP